MLALNLGDNSSSCPQVTSLSVQPGATVTVTNVTTSNGTVNYFNALDLPPAGTITAGNSQTFTSPAWLTSTGVSSVQITGSGY
jgi:hypothetical protein